MQSNNSILTSYSLLLTTHIEAVDKFHRNTNDWLSITIATNIFFEDADDRISKEELKQHQAKLSTHQKIMSAIKEIADNSRQYLNRLTGILGVLNVLIERVEGGKDDE